MVWKLECEGCPARVLPAGSTMVGRKNAAINLDDISVSRKHADLRVAALTPQQLGDPGARPGLTVTSLGQFGTKRVTAKGTTDLPKGFPVELRSGDSLRFGPQGQPHRVVHELVALACPTADAVPQDLQLTLAKLGVHLAAGVWDERCTMVLLGPPSGTSAERAAALCAGLRGLPVVETSWVQALADRVALEEPLPDPADHRPPDVQPPGGKAGACLDGYEFVFPPAATNAGPEQRLWGGGFVPEAARLAGGTVLRGAMPWPSGAQPRGRSAPTQVLVTEAADASSCRSETPGVDWLTTPALLLAAIEAGDVERALRKVEENPHKRGRDIRPECAGLQDAAGAKRRRLHDVAEDGDGGGGDGEDSDATAVPSQEAVGGDEGCQGVAEGDRRGLLQRAGDGGVADGEEEPAKGPPAGDAAGGVTVKREETAEERLCRITVRSLVVRRYNPVSSCVVQQTPGSTSVVPNFKKFSKARVLSTPPRERLPLRFTKYVQPVNAGTVQFLEEERVLMDEQREADALFHAQIKAVKAKPLPDPVDDDSGHRAGGGRHGSARAVVIDCDDDDGEGGGKVERMAHSGTLKKLKLDELKAYLKSQMLPVSGKKDDLIERITRHVCL